MKTIIKNRSDIKEVRKTETNYRIWLPETLELDPSGDNGEAFLFWLTCFNYYLCQYDEEN